MTRKDIGLIGIAVMGENIVMNMESKGFSVAVYNRTHAKIDRFLEERAGGLNISGAYSLEALVDQLKSPRKIMLMVKAGQPVDDYIEKLIPLLDEGDIIIDGGNSHYLDTERRVHYLRSKGIRFVGTGVSGGEEGALKGPSIMPGGNREAWNELKPLFQAIAAHVDGDSCCQWVGAGGAGHFVKMVHNGIEYGDMQLICEIYHLMREVLDLSNERMHTVFNEWNEGLLDSYLIEITAEILTFKEDGEYVVDRILDAAGQKGTGKWTGIAALEAGVPLTLIVEAVFARSLSALKDERVGAAEVLSGPTPTESGVDVSTVLCDLHDALYAAKIISYAQGFSLMKEVSEERDWGLDYGAVALMWRGGCIIRSAFLGKIKEAFEQDPDLKNLMLALYFSDEIIRSQQGLRKIVAFAAGHGVPVPALSAALAFYDGYRTKNLPANLLQAQRDYFGAHTYERIDRERGQYFHSNWTGESGLAASTPYDV